MKRKEAGPTRVGSDVWRCHSSASGLGRVRWGRRGIKHKRALGRCRVRDCLDGLRLQVPTHHQGTGAFELALGPALGPISPLPFSPHPAAGSLVPGRMERFVSGELLLPHNRTTCAYSLSTSFHAALVQLPFTTTVIEDFAGFCGIAAVSLVGR